MFMFKSPEHTKCGKSGKLIACSRLEHIGLQENSLNFYEWFWLNMADSALFKRQEQHNGIALLTFQPLCDVFALHLITI